MGDTPLQPMTHAEALAANCVEWIEKSGPCFLVTTFWGAR